MKVQEHAHYHAAHKHTWSGLTVGLLLLIYSAYHLLVLAPAQRPAQSVYIALVPGMALMLRALRPPIGLLRTLAALIGGALVGSAPMLLSHASENVVLAGLLLALLGAALLGMTFTVKPQRS